jgi:hypothetical protein
MRLSAYRNGWLRISKVAVKYSGFSATKGAYCPSNLPQPREIPKRNYRVTIRPIWSSEAFLRGSNILSLRPFNHLATRQVWPALCIRHCPMGHVGAKLIPTLTFRFFGASTNALDVPHVPYPGDLSGARLMCSAMTVCCTESRFGPWRSRWIPALTVGGKTGRELPTRRL